MQTLTDYRTLAEAFDYLNAQLFAGTLPDVVITLQRRANTNGYYLHDAFTDRTDAGAHVSEIALNPANFTHRSDAEILSTLAHEMTHLWQATQGKPGRGGYHNAQWARKMEEIGLEPVRSDGRPGKTGDKMTHRITAGGRFDQIIIRFLAAACLRWQSFDRAEGETTASKKRASKTKFTCPGCGQNAWAKPEAALMCLPCEEVMVAEEPEDPPDA
jgi:hypothetical protein